VQNIHINPRLDSPEAYGATICSAPQLHLDLVNLVRIRMICPVQMNNTEQLKIWLNRHPEEAIVEHTYQQPQGSISIQILKDQKMGCKLF
jgi:hypothetical protein